MGVEVCSFGNGSERVPDDEHGILAFVGSDDPLLVLRASGRRYHVAVALEQFLRFQLVVEDDASMRRRVEDFCAAISGQVMHPTIDVFVEAEDPLQVLSNKHKEGGKLQERFIRHSVRHLLHRIGRSLFKKGLVGALDLPSMSCC